jgi:hypothetical protein
MINGIEGYSGIGIGNVLKLFLGLCASGGSVVRCGGAGLTCIAASVSQTMGDSPLNLHAIIDTIGVIGESIAAQGIGKRLAFSMGTVSASWLWVVALSVGASAVSPRFCPAWGSGCSAVWVYYHAGLCGPLRDRANVRIEVGQENRCLHPHPRTSC